MADVKVSVVLTTLNEGKNLRHLLDSLVHQENLSALVFVPWSGLWDSNLLLDYISILRPLVLHKVFRAGVSVLGVVDIGIGLAELRYFLKSFKVVKGPTL